MYVGTCGEMGVGAGRSPTPSSWEDAHKIPTISPITQHHIPHRPDSLSTFYEESQTLVSDLYEIDT